MDPGYSGLFYLWHTQRRYVSAYMSSHHTRVFPFRTDVCFCQELGRGCRSKDVVRESCGCGDGIEPVRFGDKYY